MGAAPTTSTHSDRLRNELRIDPRMRSRQIGRVIHETMALLAARNEAVTINDVDAACELVLAEKPIQAPRHLSRPLMHITTHATSGMRLLPSLDWAFVDAEVDLPSGSCVDQVYARPEPHIVGGHIGTVVGIEIKTAACVDTAEQPATVAQVQRHLDGLGAVYGDDLLGVATLCLGHPRRSILTLADEQRTQVLWFDSGLCSFPDGRLDD